ncbi:hypothetical protein [Arthrobacter sp. JCM 19049]|nr:hypothetical protein [Arthrobacter sp. JCM 19049]
MAHAAFANSDPSIEPAEVGLLQELFDCPAYDPVFSIVALDETASLGT